jgi:hypothetical protein
MRIDWEEFSNPPSETHSLDCECEACRLLREAWEEYTMD